MMMKLEFRFRRRVLNPKIMAIALNNPQARSLDPLPALNGTETRLTTKTIASYGKRSKSSTLKQACPKKAIFCPTAGNRAGSRVASRAGIPAGQHQLLLSCL
jgi:hypothetical protein